MSPALELAKLYSKCLYEALQGKTHAWDELHQFAEAWRADLAWLSKVLPTVNGRRMIKREQAIRLAGDAGEVGLAVYSVGPELPHAIVGTWTYIYIWMSMIPGIALHAALQPCVLGSAKGLEQSLLLRNCSRRSKHI